MWNTIANADEVNHEDQNNMVTRANVPTFSPGAYWGLWLTGESNIEDDWDSYVGSKCSRSAGYPCYSSGIL